MQFRQRGESIAQEIEAMGRKLLLIYDSQSDAPIVMKHVGEKLVDMARVLREGRK